MLLLGGKALWVMEVVMRCYDGQPDSQLKRWISDREDARARLKKELGEDARVVYFPSEGRYSCWKNNKQISFEFDDVILAVNDAIRSSKSV